VTFWEKSNAEKNFNRGMTEIQVDLNAPVQTRNQKKKAKTVTNEVVSLEIGSCAAVNEANMILDSIMNVVSSDMSCLLQPVSQPAAVWPADNLQSIGSLVM
jgi:hypothetical protein